ncbi:hypothetical protein RHSP_10987 [Rhizobium freirei PRF 81]|uniref:Uncharacterized protein n=1 Tax=Rhizobium freirei PRF 81 TaxID=363754 RepID=N6U8I0_9HYPH|nr:hypothetical protein RHSP_10987 [Rhizobium freirei PRF 81]
MRKYIQHEEKAEHDQPADQYLLALGMIFETVVQKDRIPVEISVTAYLRPGRINAQGNDRQQDIDDPDTEIFGGVAREGSPLEIPASTDRIALFDSCHICVPPTPQEDELSAGGIPHAPGPPRDALRNTSLALPLYLRAGK